MTVSEVFKAISEHMLTGIMFHDQMADYYDFLSLPRYRDTHKEHAEHESKVYRALHEYYMNHYDRFVAEEQVENPGVIPVSWRKHSRGDVDTSTRRNAVKDGVEKWISWETETKKLYQSMVQELFADGEVAAASAIFDLVQDVDKELQYAEWKRLILDATDYDMVYIAEEQK